ncbi:uncharacterized protein IUM83_07437 [Phytophthora cinnamomi]|uniref:uncharacterized protein n=1 Tax=Phytophthora cinnamomi TaxID=4785 RepID=UPI00355A4BDA|nr:hypothetical protein IUM83_07437 [Phytophthora cinnamomi]
MLRTYSSWSRLGPRSWLPLRRRLGRMAATRRHHLTLRLELLALALLLVLVSSLAVLALLLADMSKGAGSSGTTEDSDEPPVGKSLLRAESSSGSGGAGRDGGFLRRRLSGAATEAMAHVAAASVRASAGGREKGAILDASHASVVFRTPRVMEGAEHGLRYQSAFAKRSPTRHLWRIVPARPAAKAGRAVWVGGFGFQAGLEGYMQ